MTEFASERATPRGLDRPAIIRVVQPALPAYRVPTFRELASRCNVQFVLHYGKMFNLPNATPDGFQAVFEPLKAYRVGELRWVFWHPIHLSLPPADVTFFMWDAQYLSLGPGMLRNRLKGGKNVLWGHGYSRHPSKWRDRARNAFGRRADAVLLYNHGTADRLAVVEEFDPQRVFVAPNTQDTEPARQAAARLAADPERLKAFRDEHGLTEQTPLFLQVGRASDSRRYDIHLAAFVKALGRLPGAKLAFVGSGYDSPDFESLIRKHALEKSVLRHPGSYDENDLAPWFAVATATVFADAIGLSLNHSFGYGVPVISHRERWNQMPEAEALIDDVNGLTFDRGDVEGLADKLIRIGLDPALRDRLAQAAYVTARERYTVAAMADGFIDAARYCLGQPTIT